MKNHKISIRLSEDETISIKKKADLIGLSLGQYMRFIALQADIEIGKVKVRK